MAKAEEGTRKREREGLVLARSFEFHRKYMGHACFQVTIADPVAGDFTYDVRGWWNMLRSVEAFTECVALPGIALVAKVHLYQGGEAELNGYHIRITPVT
ncbi:hypothetical protein ACWD25_29950 [Streptomyces sp. NPDC002920]